MTDLPDIAKTEAAIVELTNSFRKENRLQEVKRNAALSAAARAFAKYLASNGTFSHTADGNQPVDRAKKAGYEYCEIAENLAMRQDSDGFKSKDLAQKSLEGWQNSPGHRRNLLSPNVSEIGVGVAKAPDKIPKYIAVQLFGQPRSFMYEFRITNVTPQIVAYTFSDKPHEIKPNFTITHAACRPAAVRFERFGNGKKAKTLSAQYQATGGQTYTLKPDKSTGVRIEVALQPKAK